VNVGRALGGSKSITPKRRSRTPTFRKKVFGALLGE